MAAESAPPSLAPAADPPRARPAREKRAQRALLACILALAAALRFHALDWGLDRTPHVDEGYFVGNVARMLATGSLDHGYYEYPGLMFYLLVPVLKLAGATSPPQASAYLAARAFVAFCGVLAVALAAVFGNRLAGSWAGLAAAAFLAVSPVHVETAHMLRPDVTLEVLLLLLFLACLRVGQRLRDDARAGVVLGLAVGLKFSGALALLTYLARRLSTPGPRWRGLALAGLVAAAMFALASPYALLRGHDFQAGVHEQLSYHYTRDLELRLPYSARLLGYLQVWLLALGPLGALLAASGLALVLVRAARQWLPFLLLPPLTALVFASTDFHFSRHMLPSLSVVALLAGVALQELGRRWRAAAVALALLALAVPLGAARLYLQQIKLPSTRDLAVAWLANARPDGARVATTVNSLGLDPRRFEILRLKDLGGLAQLQLEQADAVVTSALEEGAPAFEGWPAAVSLTPQGPYSGWPLLGRLRAPGREPRWLPLEAAQLQSNVAPGLLPALVDGRAESRWSVPAGEARGAEIVVRWPRPTRVAQVELLLGAPHQPGLALRLQVSEDGRRFHPWPSVPGRPQPETQVATLRPPSEVLLFPPVSVRALRVERRAGRRPWSVAELRVAAAPD